MEGFGWKETIRVAGKLNGNRMNRGKGYAACADWQTKRLRTKRPSTGNENNMEPSP
ncbi:hypothetical protein COLO4_16259 [Corchorus olitorius]|uniref:Uncharacterized protein n=1 Tax=Corchorus olitorius TaxID=93759 RepID=A0A1R3JIC6_9ROSI|nr:hypothetical protein COLO4_16259 [Corchorus olitorius]